MPEARAESIEHEVKVDAPAGFVLPPLEGIADGVVVGEPAEQRLVADYYDTGDLRLTAAGLSLRFRTGDGSGWTAKVPTGDRGGTAGLVRREIPLPGGPDSLPASALELLEPWTGGRPLERIVRLDARRRTVRLLDRQGVALVEVADDDVAVLDGDTAAGRFREIEAEVVGPATPGLLDAVVARLRAAGAGDADPMPKVARAIGLVRPTVHAGGGVVWRPGRGGSEVLVVHRPKYDDWSLPKGKRDEGESDEACALREVEEETGLRCALGPELAATSYVDGKGRPKRVRYWAMTVDGGEFTPGDEVDEVRWLPVADARRALSYDHDRAVLDDFEGPAG